MFASADRPRIDRPRIDAPWIKRLALAAVAAVAIGRRVLLVHAEPAEAGDGLADGLAHPAVDQRERRTDERNGEPAHRNP